jgi:RHS repeat-associated protein
VNIPPGSLWLSAASCGYAGIYHHGQSWLPWAVFRPYHPSLGRWLSRDPIGEAGGLNLYGYVGNNPISFRDPLGLLAYLINQSRAVGGAGHNAIIIGDGNAYTFMSYGPQHGPLPLDNGIVETKTFDNLTDALKYAAQRGYDRYQKFDKNGCHDTDALKVGTDWNNTLYKGEGGHNSNDFASAALMADGFPWRFGSMFPNESFDNLSGTKGTHPFGPVDHGQIQNLIRQLEKPSK